MNINIVLYIISFILLILKSVGIEMNKIDIGWLGLAFFVLAFIA